MPYAPSYERVYLAFIAGLAGYGMVPTAAVYDPSSNFQLDRIIDLIVGADYSFHDLSYMGHDNAAPRTPRFNMPFELGIAVTAAKLSNSKHEWFVFDTHPHRVHKACSDLGGVNVRVHDKTPESVLQGLMSALSREGRKPTYQNLRDIYTAVAEVARRLKTDHFELFDTQPFAELSYAAAQTADRVVAKA
jgi:hypothetical protein